MSVFGKLFGAGGGKAGKGGPTPQEAIQRLRDTEEMLSKKQEFLEKKIEQELTAAKKHGTKNKRAALQALKRKKSPTIKTRQEERRGRRRHEGIGELGWIHVTGPARAGPRQTVVTCAVSRRVRVRGRQDVVQAGSIALDSLQSSRAALLLTLCIAWSAPGGTGGDGWRRGTVGGKCLLFIMLNFCKINCICKSNIELLDYADSTAESSMERVNRLQLK
ncbi:PREDICTED: charged multivesicular body protein 4b isoform X2 [Colobus angolensis palliatus]|uniref:charged multivesicular body protein 4b isoform X2 n=1 Tax=Colobus angolensis palliatus TaxID=336983 RepID=UPI0005F3F393|nr:PREDICTED: charged multivesicular body protein 4b isoform X2 [Colobus angolensis palliatus]